MPETLILSACRTAVGKHMGGLASLSAPQLGAVALREAMARANVSPEKVDEVVMGIVLSAGTGQSAARRAALGAGIPPAVAAFNVNMVCGSGLKAVMLAAQAVRAGDAQCVLAGGMESMSNAPHLLRGGRAGFRLGDAKLEDSIVADGLTCSFEKWHMGSAAEHTAAKFGITREQMDEFSLESHRRAIAAQKSGAFRDEIVSVEVPVPKGSPIRFERDEGPREETSLEKLAGLKPIFDKAGRVTAGNSSTINDGAAAVAVCSEAFARGLGATPLARIAACACSGVEPKDLFEAPIAAIAKVLSLAGWKQDDVDLFEINEAFAAQALADCKALSLPRERVNVNGGAVALGHPLGASGARCLATLLYALKNRKAKRGVVALCLGGGNAVAMAVER